MQDLTKLPPLTRLSQIVDDLIAAVRARGGPCRFPPYLAPLALAMIMVITRRAQIARARLRDLIARMQAGKLRPYKPHTKPHRPRTPAPRAADPRFRPIGFVVPRRFGWVLPLVPCFAACYANHLRLLLAEPDMQAILAATPRAAKILAPLCHMLGIEKQALTPVGCNPLACTASPTPTDIPPTRPDTPPTLNPHLIVLWRPPPSDPERDFPLLVPG